MSIESDIESVPTTSVEELARSHAQHGSVAGGIPCSMRIEPTLSGSYDGGLQGASSPEEFARSVVRDMDRIEKTLFGIVRDQDFEK